MKQQLSYVEVKKNFISPRLPLQGNIDLTYRCNNNCRHCWLWIPRDAKEKENELSFGAIKKIVDEAKNMGCRSWSISGGEPMLRPDFIDIFKYLATNSIAYSLNTNGTLITPKVAQLMKHTGNKMVALYGATAGVHDHITRNPGSFDATMRSFAYLKEAGADFVVQLIPMRDNYHQFKKMVRLAESLSPQWRVGAAWFFLSASGDLARNKEILCQRLSPQEVVMLDEPDPFFEEQIAKEKGYCNGVLAENGHLFSSCIASRRDFHLDPYGQASFCSFIKDPALRYDVRKGSFTEYWEGFVPSLRGGVKATKEYAQDCGSCKFRCDCRWCPVYGFLEHRNFSAKVDYLCAVARENRKYKDHWKQHHRRYFRVADITIQVESDLPITDATFHAKFKQFEVAGPEQDTITIRHHFFLPDLTNRNLGKKFHRKPPWTIWQNNGSLVYTNIVPGKENRSHNRVLVFNDNYNHVRIYHRDRRVFRKGNLRSLTLLSTDQILLVPALAQRQGCCLHACGVNLKGKGLLFVGHSGAGKSTMAKMLQGKAKLLCDDRIIVRRRLDGLRIYGNWAHGKMPDISAESVTLKAILFLEKSQSNQLILIDNGQVKTQRLLSCLIRPYVTADCWENALSIVGDILKEIPCYVLEFDKSGKVEKLLTQVF